MRPIIKHEGELPINPNMPFPTKILLSKCEGAAASVRLSMLSQINKLDMHSHEDNDQIEYCIEGRAIIFIEGLGEKEIHKGTFIYVPKGVKHGLVRVIEPITLLTIFVPPLF